MLLQSDCSSRSGSLRPLVSHLSYYCLVVSIDCLFFSIFSWVGPGDSYLDQSQRHSQAYAIEKPLGQVMVLVHSQPSRNKPGREKFWTVIRRPFSITGHFAGLPIYRNPVANLKGPVEFAVFFAATQGTSHEAV